MLDEGTTAEDSLNEREERESVSRRLANIDATERAVVMLRFGMSGEMPLGLEQIGARLGMSTWAVERVLTSAMRKLGRQRDPVVEASGRSKGSSSNGRLMVG
jgi:RNA polymerase sigma factor (sigma-70 family)